MPSVVSIFGYSNIPRDIATVTSAINNFLQSSVLLPLDYAESFSHCQTALNTSVTANVLDSFDIDWSSIFVQKPCPIWCGSEKGALSPSRAWFFHLSTKVLLTAPVTYRGLVKRLFPFSLPALLSPNLDLGSTQFWMTIAKLHPCNVRHCCLISLFVWISLP